MAIKAGTTAEAAILILSRQKIINRNNEGVVTYIEVFFINPARTDTTISKKTNSHLIFFLFFSLYTSSKYNTIHTVKKGIQVESFIITVK
ncbi:hypothetical protein MCC01979_14030 [Bifidobacteriaceae bacterium MCC01979]|nr:hypothetical protein MCC01979_14030 [Bifidobacteriaceae bacterium MCC01979]